MKKKDNNKITVLPDKLEITIYYPLVPVKMNTNKKKKPNKKKKLNLKPSPNLLPKIKDKNSKTKLKKRKMMI